MKRIVRNWIITLFLGLTVLTPTVLSQSFDPVFEWVKRFRQNKEVELQIQVRPDSFTVSRKEATAINKATFEQLLKDESQLSRVPYLKLTPSDYISVYYLGDRLELEAYLPRSELVSGKGANRWAKKEYIKIADYPLTQWGKFLEEALKQGLLRYVVGELNQRPYLVLYFKQEDQNKIQLGTDSLVFSDEFYQYMRISKEYPPVAGTSGFAVLVHEPHSSVSGQMQLVPGLKALIGDNQTRKFSFLVEGEYDAQSRIIGFNTLDKAVDNAANQTLGKKSLEPLVYNLLANHLIDGPMAYRLIYDRESPAIAIDDLRYLENKPLGDSPQSRLKTSQSIIKIFQEVRKIQPAETDARRVDLLAAEALMFLRADIRDIHGLSLVDYFKSLTDLLMNLASKIETLKRTQPKLQLEAEIKLLKAESNAYRAQVRIYEDALKRDVTMAEQIASHVKSSHQPVAQRIALAFIGNFHTENITSALARAKHWLCRD